MHFKKMITSAAAVFSAVVMAVMPVSMPVSAATANKIYVDDGNIMEEPIKIRTTCYIDHGYTASGEYTHYGIAAGNEDWLGYDAYVYSVDPDTGEIGDFIGKFAMRDTGAGIDTDGDGEGDSIKNKTSIDIWQTDMAAAKEWISKYGDYTYVLLTKESDPNVPYYSPNTKYTDSPTIEEKNTVIGVDLQHSGSQSAKTSIVTALKHF